MANLKFLAGVLLIVSGSIVNQPVAAQTISTLDFWLSFGELLTEDVLSKLAKVQLPSLSLPSIPKIELPQLPEVKIPDINIPEINLPEFPALPSPSQLIPITFTQPDGTPRIVYIPDPRAQSPAPAPKPAPVSVPSNSPFEKIFHLPSHPEHPNSCKCGKCLPENVRIVVVDDCNEQESESSESDERPIQVYQKKIKPTKCPCKKQRPHH